MPDSLRVLIADDEEPARRLMQRYLRKRHDVEVAAECRDGNDVAVALSDTAFDLLLLDIRMPGRDVFEVVEESDRAAIYPRSFLHGVRPLCREGLRAQRGRLSAQADFGGSSQ